MINNIVFHAASLFLCIQSVYSMDINLNNIIIENNLYEAIKLKNAGNEYNYFLKNVQEELKSFFTNFRTEVFFYSIERKLTFFEFELSLNIGVKVSSDPLYCYVYRGLFKQKDNSSEQEPTNTNNKINTIISFIKDYQDQKNIINALNLTSIPYKKINTDANPGAAVIKDNLDPAIIKKCNLKVLDDISFVKVLYHFNPWSPNPLFYINRYMENEQTMGMENAFFIELLKGISEKTVQEVVYEYLDINNTKNQCEHCGKAYKVCINTVIDLVLEHYRLEVGTLKDHKEVWGTIYSRLYYFIQNIYKKQSYSFIGCVKDNSKEHVIYSVNGNNIPSSIEQYKSDNALEANLHYFGIAVKDILRVIEYKKHMKYVKKIIFCLPIILFIAYIIKKYRTKNLSDIY